MKIEGYISPRAFWDARYDELDFSQNSKFIIIRVFDFGKWQDVIKVIEFYGEDKVIKILTEAEHLTELGLHLASMIFNINKNRFLCYTKKQYLPSSMKH